MNKRIVISGIVLIVTAIILGAFGAHALKDILSTKSLNSFEVGVRYQMYHGIAFLILGLNAKSFNFDLRTVFRLILAGVVLFSGSIYGLAMQEPLHVSMKFFGPITPIGGVLMIAGWLFLLFRIIKQKENGTV